MPSESKEFNYRTRRIINGNKESNTEPDLHPSKRIFPFRHLKDNVKRIIFNKDKGAVSLNEWPTSRKVKMDVPPSEMTKRLNDKRSLLPSENGNNKIRSFSRTMSSSIFKQSNENVSVGCSVDLSSTIKYRYRPRDQVTELITYNDGPKFRDQVGLYFYI
jgi:hypothetical protein